MNIKFKFLSIFLLLVAFSSSCKYQKLLKSTDNNDKYENAKVYYEKTDYAKAITLFEQLIPIYRGTEKGEEISYYFAYCNFHLKNYILAGHYFRTFTNSFPNSKFTEEASYMSAYCYYLDSPKTSLSQESTRKAITELELYISRYPKSERVAECNELIDDLFLKLQKKSYDNAYLYYKIGQYKAASVALKNSLDKYPNSKYREDIMYYIIKSEYIYALHSVYGKTTDRLNNTLKDYKSFVRNFPESEYMKELSKIEKDINNKLEFLN